jgi:FAD-dependent oxidoreductase domain-containing protein 1
MQDRSSIQSPDVLIVGAGVIGAATAYWLTHQDPKLKVVLLDRDPLFNQASSQRSASSIRLQFATPINLKMSQFGLQFLREATDRISTPKCKVDLHLHTPGYLNLRTYEQADVARVQHAQQCGQGAAIALLGPKDLEQRYPWLRTDSLAFGTLGEGCEGWFDGPALHQGLLRRARQNGALLCAGKVERILCNHEASDRRAIGVTFSDGKTLSAGHIVLATGAWSRSLARTAGIELPVFARRRTVFVFSCPHPPSPCPLVIDPTGFWFRPEGPHFIGGTQPDPDLDDLPLEPNFDEFTERLWIALATRIPAFEALRIERAWAGYYDMNLWDHNALLGPHPDVMNLLFGVGFSGHGMQHAPAAGRGLAECILHQRWQTLDLSDLAVDRLVCGRRLIEREVIG